MDAVLSKLAQLIREEFEDAPGLRLSVSEGSRFWGLDEMTCAYALERLVAIGFLRKGLDERYGQSSAGDRALASDRHA